MSDGLTMMGSAYVGTVATFMATGNPILTGFVGTLLTPMALTGVYDFSHGAHLLGEGITEDDECHK